MPKQQQYLDLTKRAKNYEELHEKLSSKLIGQNHVIDGFEKIFLTWKSGMYDHSRPISIIFLAGPTGTGKTYSVELLAEHIIGEPAKDSIVKINCAEFQENSTIARLIGAPPGYIGHKDTVPLLSQAVLNKSHKEGVAVSFILFDEIEKASSEFFKILLSIFDKASLVLGDNRKVDFTRCFIFLTSNIGAIDYNKLNYGFDSTKNDSDKLSLANQNILNEMKKKFPAEFLARLDDIFYFHPLQRDSLNEILKNEIEKIHIEMENNLGIDKYFTFKLTIKAENYILDQGTDLKYGARYLKRAINNLLLKPFAILLASDQIKGKDKVLVDYAGGDSLKFKLEEK